MIIRPASREDIESFSDMPNKPSMLAWAGEIDGRIVGLAGFVFSKGRWLGFCDLTEEARKHKMTIARAAKRILAEAGNRGIKFIYAEADQNEPRAVRWLTSLGFRIDPRTVYLYRWESR